MNDFKVLIEAVLDKAKLSKDIQNVQKLVNSKKVALKVNIDQANLRKDITKISGSLAKSFSKKIKLNIDSQEVLTAVKNICKEQEKLNKNPGTPAISEQVKYYSRIQENLKNIYELSKRLPAASKTETSEIERQINLLKDRNTYSSKQLSKKGLKDETLDWEIGRLDVLIKKRQEITNPKKASPSNTASNQTEIDAIDKEADLLSRILLLRKQLAQNAAAGNTSVVSSLNQQLEAEQKKYNSTYRNSSPTKDLVNSQSQLDNLNAAIKSAQSGITNLGIKWSSLKRNPELAAEFEQLVTASRSLSTAEDLSSFNKQVDTFKDKVKAANLATKDWGSALKNTVSKISNVMRTNIVARYAVAQTKKSILELKEVDTALTRISTSTNRTKKSLEDLGISAVNIAGKYGTSSTDYLNTVLQMSQAGFDDTQSEKLAELAILAQSAGNMTSDLANSYLMASNAAYGYHGNAQKLNALLDSQNQVTNRNAISFTELANATKAAAGQLANMGIDENELTALLGTGISASHKSGEDVGNAVTGIMMNLKQVSGQTGSGEIINEEALKKAEERCHSVGIELEYMKNGITQLRDPMEVLKELADVYNSLPEGGGERAGIIQDIGGPGGGDVLSSILGNWDSYEKMLSDTENAEGSALKDAMEAAKSWEGLLNQIAYNWTGFVKAFATDGFTTSVLQTINGITIALKEMTKAVGSLPTLAAGVGIFEFIKNFDWLCNKSDFKIA